MDAKDEVREVKKPEDWIAANEVSSQCQIESTSGSLTFKIRALSYNEEQKIWAAFPIPEAPKVKRGATVIANYDDPKYQEQVAEARFGRYVSVIDTCCMKLPGETIADKIFWAKENLFRGGEILTLYSEILKLSGYGNGEHEKSAASMLVGSPEDWLTVSKASSRFIIRRAGVSVAFHLKGVSASRLKTIETMTDPGQPPIQEVRGIAGRKDPVPNPQEPGYLRRVAELELARNILILESGLPFPIPGDDYKAKIEWVNQRPAGEIKSLVNAMNDIMGYRSQTDFTLGL